MSAGAMGGAASPRGTLEQWMLYGAMGLVVGGSVLLMLALWSMWRGRFRDPKRLTSPSAGTVISGGDSSAGADRMTPTGMLSEAQKLFSLMGEAEELAGRLRLDLEDRERGLRVLLEEVDQKLGETRALHAAIQQANHAARQRASAAGAGGSGGSSAAGPEPGQSPAMPVVVTMPKPMAPRAMAAALQARAQESAENVSHSPGSAGYSSPELDGPDPVTAEIYRLNDQGLSPMDIARKLGQHLGKVELILALRQ
jgi:hypothetical protein